MKRLITLFLLMITYLSFGQNLNTYKYAIVPAKFSFQKEPNEYRLNLLTKMYMESYGFETYYDTDNLSDSIIANRYDIVYVSVNELNNMFITKISIVLKDFKGNVLATSEEGSSREKEFGLSYNQAFRKAFDGFSVLKAHKYLSLQKTTEITSSKSDEIQNEQVKVDDKISATNSSSNDWTFVVKKTSNGYLITDSANPNFSLQLLKTENPQLFIGKSKDATGIVTLKNDHIVYEYYKDNILMSMLLMIKI